MHINLGLDIQTFKLLSYKWKYISKNILYVSFDVQFILSIIWYIQLSRALVLS